MKRVALDPCETLEVAEMLVHERLTGPACKSAARGVHIVAKRSDTLHIIR